MAISNLTFIRILLALLWLVVGSAASAQQQSIFINSDHPSGIQISNFAAGKSCLEGDEPTQVCGETTTINITGQSLCDWSEEIRYRCTWYAYQFDFQNARPGEEIICNVENSHVTTFGPNTEEVTGLSTARYTLEIDAADGHLFNPSYTTYAPDAPVARVRETHRCEYAGEPLFEVAYNRISHPEQ